MKKKWVWKEVVVMWRNWKISRRAYENSRYLGRYLKPGLPDYEAGVLTPQGDL